MGKVENFRMRSRHGASGSRLSTRCDCIPLIPHRTLLGGNHGIGLEIVGLAYRRKWDCSPCQAQMDSKDAFKTNTNKRVKDDRKKIGSIIFPYICIFSGLLQSFSADGLDQSCIFCFSMIFSDIYLFLCSFCLYHPFQVKGNLARIL